jgi:hypothetical protein
MHPAFLSEKMVWTNKPFQERGQDAYQIFAQSVGKTQGICLSKNKTDRE